VVNSMLPSPSIQKALLWVFNYPVGGFSYVVLLLLLIVSVDVMIQLRNSNACARHPRSVSAPTHSGAERSLHE